MSIAMIETDALKIAVATHYGARVISLLNRTTGREWMTAGGESTDTGDEVVYSDREAVAWDECFPTVGVWDATGTPWRRRLRDHGDLWGRPWQVVSQTTTSLTTRFDASLFSFVRTLSAAGPTLTADYAVTSRAAEPLPYLWALHALLAVEQGDTITLPGVDKVQASYLPDGKGGNRAPMSLPWRGPNGVLPFALEDVQPSHAGFAAKFIASGVPGGTARVGRDNDWLELAWDETIADLGIWLTYGAWHGHQEIAIEPTSAPADHIGQAIGAKALPLTPGEERRWRVTMTVGS
jgi:galactose mutarotase-like enzyme